MRLLIQLAVLALAVLWIRRILRALTENARPGTKEPKENNEAKNEAARGTPRSLVCGACGTSYDSSHQIGFTCPKCGN